MTIELPDGYTKPTYPRTPADVDHISHSSISTFLRCPRQWAFAYLEGLRRPPGVALIKGSAVDKGLSFNLEQKIASRVDLPKSDVLEVTEDAFRADVDRNGGHSEIDWNGGNMAKGLDSAIGLTDLHMTRHAPHIQPSHVQLELHRTLPDGRDFVGHLDFIEESGVVGDWKTGGKRMGQSAADSDQQPHAYAYLLDRPIDFTFYRAIDTGTRRDTEVLTTGRDNVAVAWYEESAKEVSAAINSGIFPPNTNGWHCSPKFCGFYAGCMSGQKPQIG